jgi:hypothetical protein
MTAAIVNYNTPELTRAAILSIRKHGGRDWHIIVFDNSDQRPFTKKMRGVEVIDNTQCLIINFDAELAKYDKQTHGYSLNYEFGSVKHAMSVEWLLQHTEDGFLLCDSDILLKGDPSVMMDEKMAAVGRTHKTCRLRYQVPRLLPQLCWVNAPMCRKLGVHYFDPNRSWALGTGRTEKENWYDTGASFLAELNEKMAPWWNFDTTDLIEHYGAASHSRSVLPAQKEWLTEHAKLWK